MKVKRTTVIAGMVATMIPWMMMMTVRMVMMMKTTMMIGRTSLQVIAHIHYFPVQWRGSAHTYQVKDTARTSAASQYTPGL